MSSSMLEQAVIDAQALKEAAIKSAEQEVLEKYSGDIKVLDRKPIDSQSSLLIVKVREKTFLLSVNAKETRVIETWS